MEGFEKFELYFKFCEYILKYFLLLDIFDSDSHEQDGYSFLPHSKNIGELTFIT
jgi:hypothetical protein